MATETCRDKILSQNYYDFVVPDYRSADNIVLSERIACIQDLGLGYRVIHVSSDVAGEVTLEKYGYNTIPNCYTLLDTDALDKAGISAVQHYPTLMLQGQDVMIGFLDTGIEFENPVFRNQAGGTRIAGIWDQTIQTGTLPSGFSYGSEYTEDMINEALRSDNPSMVVPTTDEIGHGTFLASVAAGGSNYENRFTGAAPEAVIGVVKLKEAKEYLKQFYEIHTDKPCYQENDIMQGLRYLNELAAKKGLPLVICVAMGTNMGGHNGDSNLSRILSSYSGMLNHCVVIGGGNEASNRHHFSGRFESVGETQEAELRVESKMTGFTAELWNSLPDIVTVYIISPSGERSPKISVRQGNKYTFDFVFDGTRVEVEYRLLLENNDSQLIFFRFQGVAAGIWKIGVESLYVAEGEYHIWLPVQEFLESQVYFLEADPDTTLTEPGNAKGAMTVTYYNSIDNSIDINSGRGYTRGRTLKPDFAAPGVEITGVLPNGRFVKRSGSSTAAGIAAGGAALLVEWLIKQPQIQGITCSQVRNIILFGTNQRSDMEYPNRQWGYGTMDIYQSLNRLREL
ncbi:MAG: S8 family peptidase [Lachnospiraceae bacterium]